MITKHAHPDDLSVCLFYSKHRATIIMPSHICDYIFSNELKQLQSGETVAVDAVVLFYHMQPSAHAQQN